MVLTAILKRFWNVCVLLFVYSILLDVYCIDRFMSIALDQCCFISNAYSFLLFDRMTYFEELESDRFQNMLFRKTHLGRQIDD